MVSIFMRMKLNKLLARFIIQQPRAFFIVFNGNHTLFHQSRLITRLIVRSGKSLSNAFPNILNQRVRNGLKGSHTSIYST